MYAIYCIKKKGYTIKSSLEARANPKTEEGLFVQVDFFLFHNFVLYTTGAIIEGHCVTLSSLITVFDPRNL